MELIQKYIKKQEKKIVTKFDFETKIIKYSNKLILNREIKTIS